jgi:hypothetical protein
MHAWLIIFVGLGVGAEIWKGVVPAGGHPSPLSSGATSTATSRFQHVGHGNTGMLSFPVFSKIMQPAAALSTTRRARKPFAVMVFPNVSSQVRLCITSRERPAAAPLLADNCLRDRSGVYWIRRMLCRQWLAWP